ncbi:MAG: hypothetical protein MJ170_01615 [Alphaproteobacteria bacterium]|nr:hypothetical protein [Alphaproteobacteria bacterium]
MMKKICAFLSVLIMAITFVAPGANAAGTDLPMGDIGDYGTWATENNRQIITNNLKTDLSNFAPQQIVPEHVPVEAKVSIAFMNAMTYIGQILDSALVRFSLIFILIMYAFWIGMETYNMMTNTSDIKQLAKDIITRGVKIAIWLIIIGFGPAKVFMWIMGPVLSLGTYMANLILDAVTTTAGVSMPDTCSAIAQYAAANAKPDMLIDANAAADMICLPTRLGDFFKTTLMLGFKWLGVGVGHSLLTFLAGIALIVLSIMCIWKFLFMALGVVADLFLTVLLLPFTAIAETTGSTQFKGIIGDIFNTFLKLFSPEKLDVQIKKFIAAAVYYVSLSAVIGICAALLGGIFNADLFGVEPTVEAGGFIIIILILRLVLYLATKTDEIAKKWGGQIQGEFGDKVKKDVTGLWNRGVTTVKDWRKVIKDSKK